MSASRFSGILNQAKGRKPEPVEVLPELAPPIASPSPALLDPPAPRGPGRPRGKRSDPTFDQVSAYLPHALYHQVRLELMKDDKGQEFSELVHELLADWLKRRPIA